MAGSSYDFGDFCNRGNNTLRVQDSSVGWIWKDVDYPNHDSGDSVLGDIRLVGRFRIRESSLRNRSFGIIASNTLECDFVA